MKLKNLFLIILLIFCFWIFRAWFLPGIISSGDLVGYYPSTFNDYFLFPNAWNWAAQNGLGGFASPEAWIYYDLILPLHISSSFGLSWAVAEKVFFLIPFLLISFISSWYFIKNLFPRNPFCLLAPLVYLFNTYIFMMVGGGQIVGISMAYAVFPLVFIQFKKITDSDNHTKSFYHAIIAGIFFALLIFFDLRFAYMFVATVILYVFLIDWKKILYVFIAFGIAGILHAFWVLPVLLSHQNPAQTLGNAFDSVQSVKYFSFAKFENSMSLLHPNWPENIFGKVSFMKPEFLIIPILAFASLLFITRKALKNAENYAELRNILFFALLGLIGAFLAKGANDPFGNLYIWLFQHIPGFVMFRDPTKWYTLVALSYSVLIPFSIWKSYEWLSEKVKVKNQKSKVQSKIQKLIPKLFVALFVFFWLFTIRQAIFGQLGGAFKSTAIPSEYTTFANYLASQKQFSRTVWVPTIQRFAFNSANHPTVSAENLFNLYDEKSLIKKLKQESTQRLLQETGVKYVIVPTDSQGELFLKDRTYSEQLYNKTVADVSHINWLRRDYQFGKLAVFVVQNPKQHFFLLRNCGNADCGLRVGDQSKCEVVGNSKCETIQLNNNLEFKQISPVEYKVTVHNAEKGDLLLFAESYDPRWELTSMKYKVSSSKYNGLLSSFVLPESGSYTFEIYYTSQKWVNIGLSISLVTLVLLVGGIVYLKRKI